VWCDVSAQRIIEPIIFEEAINSEMYMQQILHKFFEWLTDGECQYAFFQQESSATPTARGSMDTLREVSEVRQPMRLLFMRNWNTNIYRCSQLKNKRKISKGKFSISQELQCMNVNFLQNCQQCMSKNREHFQHML